MTKKILKLIRNIGIIIILFILFMRFTVLSLSPLAAYKKTESSLHYGPSDIVHTEDIDSGILFLGKYDRWISLMPVKRQFLFFWSGGGYSLGLEIDERETLNYSMGLFDDSYYYYGIINDDMVDRIEISLKDGRVFTESEFHQDLFIFTWQAKGDYDGWPGTVFRAYDGKGDLIYENIY